MSGEFTTIHIIEHSGSIQRLFAEAQYTSLALPRAAVCLFHPQQAAYIVLSLCKVGTRTSTMKNVKPGGTVVELQSLAGELSLSCARPAADG